MKSKNFILVIDDDANVRNAICDNLGICGFNMIQVDDGKKGLSYIRSSHPPDIVITDIIMPGEEGLAIIQQIRKMKTNIKVIAISGSGNVLMNGSSFLDMAKKFGADAIFPKPINMDELENTVMSFSKAMHRMEA
jgi:DNA-binding NtrC family response regulator